MVTVARRLKRDPFKEGALAKKNLGNNFPHTSADKKYLENDKIDSMASKKKVSHGVMASNPLRVNFPSRNS
mgnify:CR=1 FL=1